MIKIARTDRVRVQFDAAKVHDPGESGCVVDHDLFRSASGGEGQRDGAQPRGPLFRCPLLKKSLSLGPVHKTFENDRAILNARQRSRPNRQVIAD